MLALRLLLPLICGACAVPGGIGEGLQQTPSARDPLVQPGILQATLGGRYFDESDWQPLDDRLGFGLDYTWLDPEDWVGFCGGLHGSSARSSVGTQNLDAWTAELSLGPRFYFKPRDLAFHAYAGLSLSLAYSKLENAAGESSADTMFGGVATLGLMYELDSRQSIGVEWRSLRGTDMDPSFNPGPGDMDYDQLSFVFAVRF